MAGNRRFTKEQEKEIALFYQDRDVSFKEVGIEYNCSPSTVSNIVHSHGIKPRPRWAIGKRHHSWKGGRRLNLQGYIQYRLLPGHPFELMKNATGYVLEHRLVMAEALERPLRSDETVHHIDGDKTNNHLSNLQLRTGNHGEGVSLYCRNCGSMDIESKGL